MNQFCKNLNLENIFSKRKNADYQNVLIQSVVNARDCLMKANTIFIYIYVYVHVNLVIIPVTRDPTLCTFSDFLRRDFFENTVEEILNKMDCVHNTERQATGKSALLFYAHMQTERVL